VGKRDRGGDRRTNIGRARQKGEAEEIQKEKNTGERWRERYVHSGVGGKRQRDSDRGKETKGKVTR
jgi:hypothetical protein